MDPIADSQTLFRWQGMDLPVEVEADPSFRQLKETRLREGAVFATQSDATQRFLQTQAARIGTALAGSAGAFRFDLPESVVHPDGRVGESVVLMVPSEFRNQSVAGLFRRLPPKDNRTAFRVRLSQLDNTAYSAVRDAAGLLRFAVVRHIVHELVFVEGAAVPPAVEPEFGTDADAPEDPRERGYIAEAEETIRRMRTAMGLLRQAVSLAPYMYADEEYQIKRNAVFSRAVATGHALARCHGRQIVRTIRSRAREHSLDRGLSLSLPYFDDRAMEMRMYDFEVIPPGRTMFAPVFVVLAAHREQDNLDAKESLGPLTRLHLLAELKSLEQAFDTRPR